ncbi:MAG: hypothetical protein Q9186_001462 [Xanthomendoza sp. 1 TL-2023]
MGESILEMEQGIRNSLRKEHDYEMESLHFLAESTFTTWVVILGLSMLWHHHIEQVVPKPYLDEFFHVQQAELYLQGRFTEWHPKITTPPGLCVSGRDQCAELLTLNRYLVSITYLGALSILNLINFVEVADLRRTNAWAAGLFPFQVRSVLEGIVTRYDGFGTDLTLPILWSLAELNHTVLNICLFPPLFFFYGLYYTDVWSALSVLTTIQLHQKKQRRHMVVAAIASLFFRQTNIFWVGVYIGGLEISRKLRRGRIGTEYVPTATWRAVVVGSWQSSCIYDPLVVHASFEDSVKTTLSIIVASLKSFTVLYPYLKPYLVILGAFGLFVVWNQGVVLGLSSFPGSIRHRLPRLIVVLPIMAIMTLIIHYNTIIHPFTLADNRHYTFYVFRLLLRHPAIKYLAVPIYFTCAWAAITAFGGLPYVQTPSDATESKPLASRQRLPPPSSPSAFDRGHHVSTVLVWILATALSLITAPLVEPRYFIVPWLIWRLHMVSPWPTGEEASKKRKKKIRTFGARCKAFLYERHDHRLWLETLWLLVVNWGICYVFLKWEFEWEHEKGKVQRFMW